MQIYLARNNVQAGPYSLEQVNAMLSAGQVEFSDLMWHAGMQNWQTVGELTQNNRYYNPPIVNNTSPQVNLDKNPSDTPASQPNQSPVPDQSHQPKWVQARTNGKNMGKDIAHAQKQLELASVGSRIFPKLLDFGLFIVAIMPLYISLVNNPAFSKLMTRMSAGGNPIDNRQLMMDLMTQIPTYIIILTYAMLFAILITQVLLMVKRGQSIGKMVLGIRILDKQTNAIPKFTNLILLRSIALIALFVVSNLGFLNAQLIGIFSMALQLFFIADFVTMLVNKDKQSLHDKIASTYVVVANDNQVTPLPVNPTV